MDRTITEAEILGALREAMERPEPPPNTYTRRELEEMSGRGKDAVLAGLKKLMASGAVEAVKIHRPDSSGRGQTTIAYHFKNGKPE